MFSAILLKERGDKTMINNRLFNLVNENHILIGGATGSGKSVLLNDLLYILTSFPSNQQKLILIDLKRVELSRWQDFPHVLETITEPQDVISCLDRIIDFMEYLYKKMQKEKKTYTDNIPVHIVIDELAEVMRVKGAEQRIDTLLRLARAANIHLILATQNVSRSSGIPARLYQNVTCTIGLRCRSAIESRQIIGVAGCEKLPKYGKAYIYNGDGLNLIDIPVLTIADIIIDQLETENKIA